MMQAATDERYHPIRFRLFAGDHLAVEILVIVAMVLTAAAFYFRDPLTHREISFTPAGEDGAYLAYNFDDRDMGGTSVVLADPARPLSWTCDLREAYEYRYCGFGIFFDPTGAGGGTDLSGFDDARIVLHYQGPSDALRLVLKNKDARLLEVGASSDEQVNQMNVPVSSGAQTVEIELDQLTVAEWWRNSASRPSPEIGEPRFDNVVSLELLTEADAEPGRHRLRIDSVSFHGRTMSTEAWFAAIALAWLLLIGTLMFHRRRETVKWRAQVLASMQTTLDTIPHMVWSLDRGGKVHFNKRWEDYTGVPPGAMSRLALRRLVHADDVRRALEQWKRGVRSGSSFDIELRIRHRAGDDRWVLARTVPFREPAGAITRWYGTCTDVHDRVVAQEALRNSIRKERRRSQQLKWTSEHDPLTRLPNRRAFEARLDEATGRGGQGPSKTGLLLVDMDYFKHVNDTLGHGAGDELLRTIAVRLRQSVRRQDFVARIGGDEFAIVLANLEAETDLAALGNKVAAAIQRPLTIDGLVVRPGGSIGGAICPKNLASADEFLKRADAALYALKRSGRGGFRLFESYMLEDVERAAHQLARAREVLADETIVAHYQPKVAIRGGDVTGFEALLRYHTPQGALALPDTIAEAFNDYELAARIGETMQHRVARDVGAWIEGGLPFGRISINAAPAEFLRDDYAERLLRVLDSHDVPPDCIEIEVTEHAFLERGPEYVARALHALKAAGVTVSLDDFGTGHSSLSHMRDFPVDLIKIDRSYTSRLAGDEEIAAMIAGVIHLACSLGLDVVAEGVETSQQLELLRSMGCHFAQGHLLGAPMDATRVPGCLSRESPIRSAA